MLGQLILTPGGQGKPASGRLYGLNILRAETDPTGFWGARRLRRTVRELRRQGVLRVLAPEELMPRLEDMGLRRVNPEGFIRSQAVPLVLETLKRRGLAPDRAAVALRGQRADRDMVRTAEALCPQVRRLIIDAPRGGAELAQRLHREFGVPVLPGGERGQAALAFQEGCPTREEDTLELFGFWPRLAGLRLAVPGLEEGDREDLPLLAALWEAGQLGQEDIRVLDGACFSLDRIGADHVC